MVLKTDRLILRDMGQEDYEALCRILKDNDVMYAYEGAFSDKEVQEWLDRQTERYHQYGFGLWAVTLKDSGRMIGQCGLTMQDYREKQVLEVGYLFEKAYWHQGYAVEAAAACRDYAFNCPLSGAEISKRWTGNTQNHLNHAEIEICLRKRKR